MLEQMQVAHSIPSLWALLEHPDFQRGLEYGREAYEDFEYSGMLTETQIIRIVEEECSRRVHRHEAQQSQKLGMKPVPYLTRLGLVIGMIDEGLLSSDEAS